MIRRTASIRGVGKPAHRIFFGTAIPAMLAGSDATRLLSAAVDAGFNAIDTARSYGRAEESIAKWLKASTGNRAWYRETQMPLLAYSSLGRGFFSGRFASSDAEGAKKSLDEFARRGYLCDANLRRLACAEDIAAAHGVAVATVAMAYLLTDPMNTLAVAGMSSTKRILENREAFDFEFAPGERESLSAI